MWTTDHHSPETRRETRLFSSVVRRFCACELERICRCGLPRTRSGWSVESLTTLRATMREHGSLETTAAVLGESRRRCNVALNALIGRTPAHALAALEHLAERR